MRLVRWLTDMQILQDGGTQKGGPAFKHVHRIFTLSGGLNGLIPEGRLTLLYVVKGKRGFSYY